MSSGGYQAGVDDGEENRRMPGVVDDDDE